MIGSLGAFQPGYQASNNENVEPTRALIWTDKKQTTPEVTAVSSVEVQKAVVTVPQVIKLGTESGNGYTGVEFDHDLAEEGDPVLMGSLTCPSGVTCSIEVEDGDVTEISGYVFTGGRDGVEGKTENMRADYLAFGIWLSGTARAENDEEGDVHLRRVRRWWVAG